jgi:hypothetical protein
MRSLIIFALHRYYFLLKAFRDHGFQPVLILKLATNIPFRTFLKTPWTRYSPSQDLEDSTTQKPRVKSSP